MEYLVFVLFMVYGVDKNGEIQYGYVDKDILLDKQTQ
jgi:hypothetical protein